MHHVRRAVEAARWRLTFATALTDLEGVTFDTARMVVRANIEEWWHTHRAEPTTARMGQRLDG
jgi:hypothetical protein